MKKLISTMLFTSNIILAQTYVPQNVKDINVYGDAGIASLVQLGTKVIFSANDSLNGNEPWVSDGTAAGTFLLNDINPGVTNLVPNSSSSGNYMEYNSMILFTANTPLGTSLWKTDGTTVGTVKLYQFALGSIIGSFITHSGNVYFQANDGVTGQELWKTDGTAAGTSLVKDINLGAAHSYAQYLCSHTDGKIYFQADNGVNGAELWVSDGTAGGTYMVLDMLTTPFVSSGSFPTNFYSYNGTIYFGGYDPVNKLQLWKTDGTAVGTTLVKIINPSDNGFPSQFNTVNGKMVFLAEGQFGNGELWVSDGTGSGTSLLKDINNSTTSSSSPTNFYIINNTMYFSANNGVIGRELWKTDGTNIGTILAADLNSGVLSSDPGTFYYNGIDFYMSVNVGTGTNELMIYSLASNTVTLKCKINPVGSSSPAYLFELGTGLFTVARGTLGKEIYEVVLAPTTGINEINNSNAITLYPNPCNDKIKLSESVKDKSYIVIDITGNVVLDGTYNGEINTNSIAPGMYFVLIGSNKMKFIKK